MNTKQNEQKLFEIFKEFDKNHDGTLTLDELKEGFIEYLGERMFFEQDLYKIIKNVDLNQNGIIEYSEFVAATSNLKLMMTDKNLKYAFDLFDLDNNGEITPRELKHVLNNDVQELNDSMWENLIEEFDQNKDG